jgi:hypothetical protein
MVWACVNVQTSPLPKKRIGPLLKITYRGPLLWETLPGPGKKPLSNPGTNQFEIHWLWKDKYRSNFMTVVWRVMTSLSVNVEIRNIVKTQW